MKKAIFSGVVLMLFLVLVSGNRIAAASEDTFSVAVTGTYDQTGARSMLQMVNDFRTNEGTEEGDQAWWLDPNGSGERIAQNGLSGMIYDYELERIAMQRAAEIAVSYSHTRPDGVTSVFDLSDGVNGENIAYGQTSAQQVFEGWLEADESTFKDQGHRVNMLGGYIVMEDGEIVQNFMTTIGIAHFIYDGVDFWVQEFGMYVMDGVESEACDEEKTVQVEVGESLVSEYVLNVTDGITIEYGETVDLDEADIVDTIETIAVVVNRGQSRYLGGKKNRFPIESACTWEVPDEYASLASLNGSLLQGTAVGEGSLTVTNEQGGSEEVSLKVTAKDIADAVVTAETTEFTVGQTLNWYSSVLPAVVLDGHELQFGTDYALKICHQDGSVYQESLTTTDQEYTLQSAATWYEEICGIGNYAGAAGTRIEITVVPISSFDISFQSETSLSLTYGGEGAQAAISSPYYTIIDSLNKPAAVVSDGGIVSVAVGDGVQDVSNRRASYALTFNPKAPGSTTVDVYFREQENVCCESGHIVFTVTVGPADIQQADVSLAESAHAYTGDPIRPKPDVYLGSEKLTEDVDYSVSYEINGETVEDPVGYVQDETQVRIVITGLNGKVTGETQCWFTITPMTFDISIDASYPYQPEGVYPLPVVSCNGTALVKDEDYTVSYGENKEAGTGKGSVTVTGIGDYLVSGEQTILFDISPADITDAAVTAEQTEFEVGKTIAWYGSILPGATLDEQELVFGTDYTISIYQQDGSLYQEGISSENSFYTLRSASTWFMEICGTGNYTGSAEERIEITVSPISSFEITAQSETSLSFEYGSEAAQAIVCSPFYEIRNDIGKPAAVVSDGEIVSVTVENGPEDVSRLNAAYKLTFTPKAVGSTTVDVYFAQKEGICCESTHIVFSVTVSRIRFDQHVTASFVNEDEEYTYNPDGSGLEPEIEVYYDGTAKLSENTDYVIAYEDNIYAGTAKAVISPADTAHYEGTVTLTFEIQTHPAEMVTEAGNVELGFGETKTVAFSGAYSAQDPELTVSGECITASLTSFDYTTGEGEITIKGLRTGTALIGLAQEADNRYSGTSGSVSVTVTEKTVPEEQVEIGLSQNTYEYDGTEKEPVVTVKADGVVLGEDLYQVAYSQNTDPGTAYVMISGMNGPVFTKSAAFEICLCDTSALSGLISQAEKELESARISEDGSEVLSSEQWVTQAACDALNGSLQAAKELLETGKYTAAQVGGAAGTLEEALGSFSREKKDGLIPKETEGNQNHDSQGQDGQTQGGTVGSDGTPAGAGALASAAEQAILSGAGGEEGPAGTTFGLLQAKLKKAKNTSVKLTWKNIAVKYRIYGNMCGSGQKYRYITTVKGNSFTQSGLKKGTCYKFLIMAEDAGGRVVATSKALHVVTSGKKLSNPKKVTVKKKTLKLKKGKSEKISASIVKPGGKKVKTHRKLSYESANPKIATVSKKGKVKAVSKGTTVIYVYAQNGVFAKVKVKVK